MNHCFPLLSILTFTALAGTTLGQTTAIFPDEYIAVPEGPLNSANLPLANGTSRVMCLYEAIDIAIPSGHNITKVGFRQDATLTTIDTGRTVNLEIRMGYSTLTSTSMSATYATNYAAPPVTVFGPANVVLPNLRDSANPLVGGKFFITLTTPFSYVPAGQNLIVEYRCFGNSGGGAPFNYRLDRADYYSPITYGPAGCPHAGGGTPTISLVPVRPGLSYTCSVATAPSNSPCVLLLQTGQQIVAPYPLTGAFAGINPLCTGQINPVNMLSLSGLTTTTGTGSWSFVVPNNPVFADFYIASQAAFLDLFAPGGLVVSRGADVLTGSKSRSSIVAAAGAPTSLTAGTLSLNYCPVAFFEHQ